MIPQVKFVQGGAAVQPISSAPAVQAAASGAAIGEALQNLGEKGFRVAQQSREAKEAGEMSKFLLGLDEQTAQFSNELMSRSDVKNWVPEWRAKVDAAREQFGQLDLSPEARDRMSVRFDEWASQRSIGFETQVAQRTVLESRAIIGNAVQYHTSRGDFQAAREQASLLPGTGVPESEVTKVTQEIDRSEAVMDMERMAEENPQTALETLKEPDYVKLTPGVTEADRQRGIQIAEKQIEDHRKTEYDTLENKFFDGKLQETDVANATYLTEKDKRAFKDTLTSSKVPTVEDHASAWHDLAALRNARDNPSVTDQEYLKQFNETRGTVLGKISPHYQGDVKKELGYLSPAGRSPGGGSVNGGYNHEDLAAIGRTVIFDARDTNQFGDIEDPKTKGAAFTKAEQLRAELNRWLRTDEGKQAGPDAVKAHAAGLTIGNLTSTAAARFQKSVPGVGVGLRAAPVPPRSGDPTIPDLPTGTGGADSSLLPPKDQLESRLK